MENIYVGQKQTGIFKRLSFLAKSAVSKRHIRRKALFSQSDHQKQQFMSDLHNNQILFTTLWSYSDTKWLCPQLKEATSPTVLPPSQEPQYAMIEWCRGYKGLAPSAQHRTTPKSHTSSSTSSGISKGLRCDCIMTRLPPLPRPAFVPLLYVLFLRSLPNKWSTQGTRHETNHSKQTFGLHTCCLPNMELEPNNRWSPVLFLSCCCWGKMGKMSSGEDVQ